MDGIGEHNAKQNKQDSERQIPHSFLSYVDSWEKKRQKKVEGEQFRKKGIRVVRGME
jgi:hypothetical protein